MIKINIGCGYDIKEDYVNIDIRRLDGVDVVCDLRLLPYSSDSIDEIYMKEILEHFSCVDVDHILSKCYWWLRPGGKLWIKVPDLEECAKVILSGDRVDEIILRLYGGQQHEYNFHKCGFTKKTMTNKLKKQGFKDINTETIGWNFVATAVK